MNQIVKYIISFFLIALFQVLILKRIDINFNRFQYFHLMIYPLFLLILPVRTPKSLMVVIGFFLGLFIDAFYDSPGVHACAATFTAFIRSYVLKIVEPTEGYNTTAVPSIRAFTIGGFFIYASILLLVHLFIYFSLEAFSFIYIGEILLRTIFSFIVSIILLMLVQLIFSRK